MKCIGDLTWVVDGQRYSRKVVVGKCPAHDDTEFSLFMMKSRSADRSVVVCLQGCSSSDIVAIWDAEAAKRAAEAKSRK